MSKKSVKVNKGEDVFSPFSCDKKIDIDVEQLWEKIYKYLILILKSEFADGGKRIPITHSDRIQCACIYCGDSAKDSHKKRGNLFFNSLRYYCFNGDCNACMSIYDFLKDNKVLNKFTIPEQNYLKTNNNSNKSRHLKISKHLDAFFSDKINDIVIDRSFIMDRLNLQEIDKSKIRTYLHNRLQFDKKRLAYDKKANNIHIFNLTKDDKIIGMQIKTFNKKTPYLTYKLLNLHRILGIYKEENDEILKKMNVFSNIFGIFNVNINKPITIFEGPLDSFLFPNSVATCSVKNDVPFSLSSNRYFFDNDKAGREYSMKKIKEGFEVFLWKKYLRDNNLLKYGNKIKDLNDLLIFMEKNKKSYSKFINYFSSDKYDIMWI